MENEIFKDAPRTKMVTTRLTKAEYKICKRACKERKITLAQLVRYSLDVVLKDKK
ncbi:MAG: hypothetical protein M1292_03875 [Bacteroidetes bacterium]|nr:hypothetical protein [Bacteroidota bacterium]